MHALSRLFDPRGVAVIDKTISRGQLDDIDLNRDVATPGADRWFIGPDGIRVRLGNSWSEDFMTQEPADRGRGDVVA